MTSKPEVNTKLRTVWRRKINLVKKSVSEAQITNFFLKNTKLQRAILQWVCYKL